MKTNWIKGLDRIAVVIAIPIALFFGFYKASEYKNKKQLFAFQPELLTLNYMMDPAVYDFSLKKVRNWGLTDRQVMDYCNDYNDSRAPQIEQGIKKGFNLKDLKIASPCKMELFLVGLLWTLGVAIISVFAVAVTTRGIPKTIRWLNEGFFPKN